MYLITGVNGFVGRHLARYLIEQNLPVRGTVRSSNVSGEFATYNLGDIDGHTNWKAALEGVDTVFHLAATVHRPDIKDFNVYQTSIVDATRNLALQAAETGIRRLVYLSTSHVYGVNASSYPIIESHPLRPLTPYGCAKAAAENILLEVAQKTNLQVVIVRPPLVYGPGVKGNFAQLIKLVDMLPVLPFGAANGKRSFVGIENLVIFLQLCSQHTETANKVFNISDGHDVSTRQLCIMLAKMLGKHRVLIPIPEAYMRVILRAIKKIDLYEKLFQSVCLDLNLAENVLGWRPARSIEEQLQALFLYK